MLLQKFHKPCHRLALQVVELFLSRLIAGNDFLQNLFGGGNAGTAVFRPLSKILAAHREPLAQQFLACFLGLESNINFTLQFVLRRLVLSNRFFQNPAIDMLKDRFLPAACCPHLRSAHDFGQSKIIFHPQGPARRR